MNTAAKKQFIKWVKDNDPFLFEIAKKRYQIEQGQNLNGLMDTVTGIFNSVADTVKNVAPSIIQFKSQKKILDLQLERAKQGLPPIDAAAYTPTVKVAAEITPENEAAAKRIAVETAKTAAQGMQKYMLMGIAGVLVYVLARGRR